MLSSSLEVVLSVRRRERTVRSVVEDSLAAARSAPRGILLSLDEDGALARAEALDRRIDAGEDPGPLAGLTVAVKDNICLRGIRVTCASRILENFVSPYSATAIERLESAGAVMVGKTNLDEFAMGSDSTTGAFGVVPNPIAPGRVAGGSSGGSAAAVAQGIVPVALGSDTGGSIRQPASFCGVVGLKPTYGRVSRYGLVAYASSLDQIGPLSCDIAGAALVLGAMAGADPRDTTTSAAPVPDWSAMLDEGVQGLRVGIPAEYWGEGLDAGVRTCLENAVGILERNGAHVVPLSLPSTPHAIAAYYILATAEASSNLARFDGVRYTGRAEGVDDLESLFARTRGELFGAEVRKRILLGTFVLSSGHYDAFYAKAQRVRRRVREDFDAAFTRCDVLAAPASPVLPWEPGVLLEDPMAVYLADIDTVAVNLAGLPGLVVPAGFAEGLPVGLQLVGPPLREDLLFRTGRVLETSNEVMD